MAVRCRAVGRRVEHQPRPHRPQPHRRAVLVLCVLLAFHTSHQPFAYWVGGWRPRHGVAIGISLSIDPIGAGMAAFASILVLAALVYSWRYFDAVKGLFHGLMLLFMGGMV